MQKITPNKATFKKLKPALSFSVGTIKEEIKQGLSTVYSTNDGNLLVVIRPEKNTLVVVAAVGKKLALSAKEIINYAVKNGFEFIRFHTKLPKSLRGAIDNFPVELVEVRKNILSKEFVYILDLKRFYHGW